MAIRPAALADLGRLREIRGAVRENILSDPARATQRGCEDHLGPAGCIWVHEENGVILGFSAATREGASIWALFVQPGQEGRGIGRLDARHPGRHQAAVRHRVAAVAAFLR